MSDFEFPKPDLTDFASFCTQMSDWITGRCSVCRGYPKGTHCRTCGGSGIRAHPWGVGSRVQAEGRWGTVVRREAHYPSKEWDDSEYTLVLFDGQTEPVVTYLGDLVGEPPSPIQYLDLTDQWERFGEWLDREERIKGITKVFALSVEHHQWWPPQNIVLLGQASTQGGVKRWLCRHIPEHSRYMDLTGWREALLLEPVEELDIRFDAIAKVEQIIVRPPQWPVHCDECDGKGEYGQDDPCLVCDAKGKIPLERLLRTYPKFRDSIIRQVREIRGECEWCHGNENDGSPRDSCFSCGSSGLAPGLPRLLIEGDERYQERLKP